VFLNGLKDKISQFLIVPVLARVRPGKNSGWLRRVQTPMERQERPHNLSYPLWDGPGGTGLLGILSLYTAQNSNFSRVPCTLEEEYTSQERMPNTHMYTHMYTHI
jgi:hypothetical protein